MKNFITNVLACLVILLFGVTEANAEQFSVLLFTKTDGLHHKSINAAVTSIQELAKKHHFALEWHERASEINGEIYWAATGRGVKSVPGSE